MLVRTLERDCRGWAKGISGKKIETVTVTHRFVRGAKVVATVRL
jgi:hypothetical protein